MDVVTIEAMPWSQHPDRAAVAYCLMYSSSVAGGFQLGEAGCSPHVADAIAAFFAPTNVRVFPISFTPSRIVGGDTVLEIDLQGGGANKPGPGGALISFVHGGVGSIATMEGLVVATNAGLLANESGSALERILPLLGVAVLFCEDLFVGAIRLPCSLVSGEDAKLLERLRQLLDAVGLRINMA
jgi:hypothetical protein